MVDTVTPHHSFRETSLTVFDTSNCSIGSLAKERIELERICLREEQCFQELSFAMGYTGDNKEATLMVTQRELHHHPPFGYTSRIHLVIKGNQYSVNVLGIKFQSGLVSSGSEIHELCRMFSNQSLYKFCPGIEWDFYEEHYHSVICCHLKSVRYTTAPFERVDSVNCMLWFKLPPNAPLEDRYAKEIMCPSCKRLKADLNWQKTYPECKSFQKD